jgi:NADPH:quinone reductase-like Zn-dependent oxidoreductase
VRAAIFKNKNEPLVLGEMDTPIPVKDQVLVRMKSAALNHRDYWILHEQKTPLDMGLVLGSDGSGVVEAVGEDAENIDIGMKVVINPSMEWGKNPFVHGDAFKILGFPDNGTFADYLLISKKYVFDKPEHLSYEEAAAVPLSGLTAYRALFTKARLRPGEKVLVTGIGGGAALWALQFARAFGARVYVTSGSEDKIKTAIKLGASRGFNYNEPEWHIDALKESGGFDVIIDSAGGSDFSKLLEVAVPGARVVNFGRTAGAVTEFMTRLLFWKQISLLGTTMGTRDEFLSMLDFLHTHQLKPVIDATYPLEEINKGFERMHQGNQFGKIVIKISN